MFLKFVRFSSVLKAKRTELVLLSCIDRHITDERPHLLLLIDFSFEFQIVEDYANRGAAFILGQTCATGPVGPAV